MPISQQTIELLIENKLRNDRQWYQEHKPEYHRYVLGPFIELVEALAPTMKQIDPLIVTEAKVGKTISRLYRDTRFSKDKSLYRDVVWFCFRRSKQDYPYAPGLVFELSPDQFRYGCGYYCLPPKKMTEMRELILNEDSSFLAAQKAFASQKTFVMVGDLYQRCRFPAQPPEKQQWLQRKQISFLCYSQDADLLFSNHLADHLAKDFLLLQPIYEFFYKAFVG